MARRAARLLRRAHHQRQRRGRHHQGQGHQTPRLRTPHLQRLRRPRAHSMWWTRTTDASPPNRQEPNSQPALQGQGLGRLGDLGVLLADAATGMSARSKRSSATACRCSSAPTGTTRGARPGRIGGLYDGMCRVLARPRTGVLCTGNARSPASPCSAQIKVDRASRRPRRRQAACGREWRAIAATQRPGYRNSVGARPLPVLDSVRGGPCAATDDG
jgi:hypothetical protein